MSGTVRASGNSPLRNPSSNVLGQGGSQPEVILATSGETSGCDN